MLWRCGPPLLTFAIALAACSSPSTLTGTGAQGTGGSGAGGSGTGGHGGTSTTADGGPDASDAADADTPPDASDAGPDADAPPADTLGSNRDRLLGTYFDYLKANPGTTQSNGLSGGNVSSVCELWQKLDPSSQATFLTLTARMQGSTLGADGSSMLWHIQKLYRVSGGQGATASDPGSCGGGEYNRMIMSMDPELHAAELAANTHKGAVQGNGKYDISDIPSGGYWRDSHDLAGPHGPFDRSDETNDGAPRGQTQFFADPASGAANAPLGRLDLTSLVDPYAIEFDQDYDCVHASNPLCSYITYGPLCFPEASALGTELYQKTYGAFDPGWVPSGCGP